MKKLFITGVAGLPGETMAEGQIAHGRVSRAEKEINLVKENNL